VSLPLLVVCLPQLALHVRFGSLQAGQMHHQWGTTDGAFVGKLLDLLQALLKPSPELSFANAD